MRSRIEHVLSPYYEGAEYEIRGRVIAYRNLGKVAFAKIQDDSGRMQVVLNMQENKTLFFEWAKNIRIGDIVGVSGLTHTTKTGERSILAGHIELFARSEHPFPDKWNGIVDPETRLRKRYLDIILDEDVRNVFKLRSQVISKLRLILSDWDFMEIETPILSSVASGAQARPFTTHHNALDAELTLRIAPETYLKRAVASGFNNVFEIGKNFRNEGIDPSHLQEFTAIEWYVAYWSYLDNLEFFEGIWSRLVEMSPHYRDGYISYQGNTIQVDGPIPRATYHELFLEHTGKRPEDFGSSKEIDEVFKRKIRPNLTQPIFVLDYPAHMSPLAKRHEDNPELVEQWQLIVNGWEIVKCYSELVDPKIQRQLLEEQAQLKNAGDDEAVALEEDFLECMEYGMPPMSGLGMGIDRLVALLADQKSLKDVVMFPLVL
jgi:lysyl-tRNA synthetase class 2